MKENVISDKGESMCLLILYKNMGVRIFIAVIVTTLIFSKTNAQEFPYESLRKELAKMACQIPPDERKSVALMELRLDRDELHDCVGKPIAETMIEVLREFQFTFVGKDPFYVETLNRKARLDHSNVLDIGKSIGAKSILTGTVNTDREFIQVKCRIIRIETMEIIGHFSCNLSKKEFGACFIKDYLTSPIQRIQRLYPEPRRVN